MQAPPRSIGSNGDACVIGNADDLEERRDHAVRIDELDALAAREKASLHVLTVSQDMQPDKVQPFLTERKLTNLVAYRDADLKFSTGMGVSLPTTILYDKQGRELWRVTGERDWASAESRALLTEA